MNDSEWEIDYYINLAKLVPIIPFLSTYVLL